MNEFTSWNYSPIIPQNTKICKKRSDKCQRNLIRFLGNYIFKEKLQLVLFLILLIFSINSTIAFSQPARPIFNYLVSIPQPDSHSIQIELHTSGWNQDTLQFKMPNWMPGYYQIMDYFKTVENIMAKDNYGENMPIKTINDNTWSIAAVKNKSFIISYTIRTNRQFVANSFVDNTHAYLIPENIFLYADGFIQTPVTVKLNFKNEWKQIATGLELVEGKTDEFVAADFDILYDCPILIGNLEELPSFKVSGIEHRFIGYNIGNFDKVAFMSSLKKIVETSIATIGDIPYHQFTFIAIGPGRGGIEHLNNTTISFDGNGLSSPEAMNRMMSFITHEYFHNYNVKRIRPFELGPFDYDKGNRTNQLWVSEGLSVYYEYLIVKRAGLMNENALFLHFDENLNAVENNPGRLFQSLSQASYSTWDEGPFGTQGENPQKSISYYDKGPVVGLFLDFEIRNATKNKKSLDDVMRLLYWKYYKTKQRGFTDAEFQQACEQVAGINLSNLFEYIYTTKELDYAKYLGYAGLRVIKQIISSGDKTEKQKLVISRIDNPNPLKSAILKAWLGE